MHSEEVNKLNVALGYCDQLKNNLQASILHVQMLNRKYNTTDYTLSFSTSIFGCPQNNQSKQQQNCCPTPKKKEQIRSVNDIKHNFNQIIVNGIKLRREIETTSTQLKLLRNDHQIESPYIIKRRLQSANNSSFSSSSSGCRHGRCFQNSSLDTFDTRDHSGVASVARSSYSFTQQTPSARETLQRKRTRETLHNQLAMITMNRAVTQSPVNVKKFRFQSTPIKINEPTTTFHSHANRSCSLNSSAINSSSSFSQLIVDDESCGGNTKHSPIKPCFLNSNSNESVRVDSPKRICWTPLVKVKRISIYQ